MKKKFLKQDKIFKKKKSHIACGKKTCANVE